MVEHSTEEELLAKLPEEWRSTVQQLVELKVNSAMEVFEKKFQDQLEALKGEKKDGPATGKNKREPMVRRNSGTNNSVEESKSLPPRPQTARKTPAVELTEEEKLKKEE